MRSMNQHYARKIMGMLVVILEARVLPRDGHAKRLSKGYS